MVEALVSACEVHNQYFNLLKIPLKHSDFTASGSEQ